MASLMALAVSGLTSFSETSHMVSDLDSTSLTMTSVEAPSSGLQLVSTSASSMTRQSARQTNLFFITSNTSICRGILRPNNTFLFYYN